MNGPPSRPTHLQVEHLIQPLGTTCRSPRLSWWLPAGASVQEAYRILDVAYELLLQDTPPSWLHMVDKGATTIWEFWEGLDRHGTGSLNHYRCRLTE